MKAWDTSCPIDQPIKNNNTTYDIDCYPTFNDIPQYPRLTFKQWSHGQTLQRPKRTSLSHSVVTKAPHQKGNKVQAAKLTRHVTLNRDMSRHRNKQMEHLCKMLQILQQQQENQLNRKKMLQHRQIHLDRQNAQLQMMIEVSCYNLPKDRLQTARFETVQEQQKLYSCSGSTSLTSPY